MDMITEERSPSFVKVKERIDQCLLRHRPSCLLAVHVYSIPLYLTQNRIFKYPSRALKSGVQSLSFDCDNCSSPFATSSSLPAT